MTLTGRDALLSRLCGQNWPFSSLLTAVEVPSQARVLDIGGGEGELLKELIRRGHAGGRELIDLKSGTDAHALPFEDASFDAVFMLRVLPHLEHPPLALAEAWRVLAVGGRLIVAANGPKHLAGVLEPGRAGTVPVDIPEARVHPFQVNLPVSLSRSDVQALAASYGLDTPATGELQSQLQLSGWVISKP